MPREGQAWIGHLFSVLCLLASAGWSLTAAWHPELGWATIPLLLIAVVAEGSKYIIGRTLWITRGVSRTGRGVCYLWYIGCICTTVFLSQTLVVEATGEQEAAIAAQVSQSEAVAAESERVKGEVRAKKAAVDDARSRFTLGIQSSGALRELLRGQLSRNERAMATADLAKAEENDRANARIGRLLAEIQELEKKLAIPTPERSQDLRERSDVHKIQNVHKVHERLNVLSLALAILLEAGIAGGIWADGLYNRWRAMPEPVIAPVLPVNVAPKSVNAAKFVSWLEREWKSKRGRDGWLVGKQKGWALTAGVSVGFVHGQLNTLVTAGRIEKEAEPGGGGYTRIRFLKVGELKAVT